MPRASQAVSMRGHKSVMVAALLAAALAHKGDQARTGSQLGYQILKSRRKKSVGSSSIS